MESGEAYMEREVVAREEQLHASSNRRLLVAMDGSEDISLERFAQSILLKLNKAPNSQCLTSR